MSPILANRPHLCAKLTKTRRGTGTGRGERGMQGGLGSWYSRGLRGTGQTPRPGLVLPLVSNDELTSCRPVRAARPASGRQRMFWESAKVSHKRVFALLTPEIMLQKSVFALPGCQRMSVNTLLCDTLGLAEQRMFQKITFKPRALWPTKLGS